jgi:hypothetical protein
LGNNQFFFNHWIDGCSWPNKWKTFGKILNCFCYAWGLGHQLWWLKVGDQKFSITNCGD